MAELTCAASIWQLHQLIISPWNPQDQKLYSDAIQQRTLLAPQCSPYHEWGLADDFRDSRCLKDLRTIITSIGAGHTLDTVITHWGKAFWRFRYNITQLSDICSTPSISMSANLMFSDFSVSSGESLFHLGVWFGTLPSIDTTFSERLRPRSPNTRATKSPRRPRSKEDHCMTWLD